MGVMGPGDTRGSLAAKNPRSCKGLEEIRRFPRMREQAEGVKSENPARLISKAYGDPRASFQG